MARSRSFRELIAWQKAMKLANAAYRLSNDLPRKEAYGLISQMQRAAVSVPSNIAEGHGRLTDLQFRHFLAEKVKGFMEQSVEVARLINGLITSLREERRASRTSLTPLTARSAANSASSAKKELN